MGKELKKAAIFDLDGTLVASHLWLALLKHHFKNKINRLPTFKYLISHFGLIPLWRIGLIPTKEYYYSWGKDIAQLMKGLDEEKADKIFNHVAEHYLLPDLRQNVLEKLKKHQEDGFLTILISGSLRGLVEIIAKKLNIDFAIGTEIEVVKNKLSGRIIPPLCFAEGKLEKMKRFLTEQNLDLNLKESFSYADGIYDLPILEIVGHPVAVKPDKKLLTFAKNKGWQII